MYFLKKLKFYKIYHIQVFTFCDFLCLNIWIHAKYTKIEFFLLDVICCDLSKIDDEFVWVDVLERLSNGDMTKEKKLIKLPYIAVMNKMAYYKQRDKVIEQENRKNQQWP